MGNLIPPFSELKNFEMTQTSQVTSAKMETQ